MMILYHTGFQEIQYPDIHHGRKNADFEQALDQMESKYVHEKS